MTREDRQPRGDGAMSQRDQRRPSAPDPATAETAPPRRSRARRGVDEESAAEPLADGETEAIPVPRQTRRVNLSPRRREPDLADDEVFEEPAAPIAPPPKPPRRAPRRAAHSADTAPTDDPTDPALWDDATVEWAETTDDGWEEALAPVEPVAAPPRRSRARARVGSRPRQTMTMPAIRVPGFPPLSGLFADRMIPILLGAGAVGVMLMVALLSNQLDGLDEAIVIHLDAAGLPDRWGPPEVLWRLPLMAAMAILLNLVIAWAVSPIDRFAARFVVAASLGVQVIVWVAVLDFLF